jgi:hypothetical protein
MFQPVKTAVLAGAAALSACSPTLDWREVRVDAAGLNAVFPCKPDRETRQVAMAGRAVPVQALACRAGGSTFAVMAADIGGPAAAGEVLRQWRAASLGGMAGETVRTTLFHPRGALELPESVQVVAAGRRPDGSKVVSQAAYFARGSHAFQTVIYTSELKPELADPFFGGIRFE